MASKPKKSPQGGRHKRTKILGVRMNAEYVVEVKSEAAIRKVSVAKLFEEMWQIYLRNRPEI